MASESGEEQTSAEAAKSCGCAGGSDCGCDSCRAKTSGAWVYALGTVGSAIPEFFRGKGVHTGHQPE